MARRYTRNGKLYQVTREPRNPNVKIRIPGYNDPAHREGLHDCLIEAAQARHMTPLDMALAMECFLQAVCNRMINGQVVRIPGFGVFGPMTRFRNVTMPAFGKGNGRLAFPAFVSCGALRRAVALYVSPAKSKEADPMRRLQKNGGKRRWTGKLIDIDDSFETIRKRFSEYNRPRNMVRKTPLVLVDLD